MNWFWTWGGLCFGYRRGNALFTSDGQQVGRFRDGEVYAADGRYLGEIRDRNRLITDLSKKSQTRTPFLPRQSSPYRRCPAFAANALLAGYTDFPSVNILKVQMQE